ncbi:hypothetical protein [Pseudalkalibacillus caeni]|uniref:DUF4064 domain-containing protein n=1 Tax=Exobacillus caeni TaxID=2574798 RepID=A0A5R9F5N4_9BACL|nr:hypothetical protein [Pseudalkalibacillus caeni]TLS38847.1 hypothetical protein FCL54_00585 [Pseudalkalibacillus caeni]
MKALILLNAILGGIFGTAGGLIQIALEGGVERADISGSGALVILISVLSIYLGYTAKKHADLSGYGLLGIAFIGVLFTGFLYIIAFAFHTAAGGLALSLARKEYYR